MMTCTARLNVISFSAYATAVEGSNHTLHCQYKIPDLGSNGHVIVDWLKLKQDHYYYNSLADIDQTVHIWIAANYMDNASRGLNEALNEHRKRQLTGSSISFPDFLSEHSITFIRMKLDDAGKYRCCVSIVGQRETCSIWSHVEVIGKYIPHMQIYVMN